MIKHLIPVTPELEAEYADKNCWRTAEDMEVKGVICGKRGPDGGRCTLKPKHGHIHIAHNYATSYDSRRPETIYKAWMDVEADLLMDEGL